MRQMAKMLALGIALAFSTCDPGPELPGEGSYAAKRLGDADPDGDGVVDIADNCPLEPNANQANRDGDEFGDPCDPCPSTVLNVEGCPQDDDGDRVANMTDNCPKVANPDQADTDGDARGDACPRDGQDDADHDGMSALNDNCPFLANSYQADSDLDGIGDACDEDDDGDGTADAADLCPDTATAATADRQGCSLADSCPCDGVWKNHAAFVACVSMTSQALLGARLMLPSKRAEAVSDAARSTCGDRGPESERALVL